MRTDGVFTSFHVAVVDETSMSSRSKTDGRHSETRATAAAAQSDGTTTERQHQHHHQRQQQTTDGRTRYRVFVDMDALPTALPPPLSLSTPATHPH
jgi:hypothetical protein